MDQLELFYRFGAALGLGLLVGLQREYHYVEPDASSFAGARTFSLIALLGSAAALAADRLASPWPFVGIILPLGILIAVSYAMTSRNGDIGATTEVAALLVVIVGALCYWGELALAGALTVATTVLLSLKIEMRSFVRRIDREDIEATLKFAVITAIILPILPNQGFGPSPINVLNPYRIWLMVVFISGISFLGYLLTKMVDPRQGIGLTGLLGGLVSSTAVTLSMTERSKETRGLGGALALALIAAWTIMFGRILVEVAVVNAPLLRNVWLPIVAAAAVGLAYAIYLYMTDRSDRSEQKENIEVSNPFQLGTAVQFGLLYGVILLVAKAAEMYLGTTGVYLSSVVGGLTDVDAITLSMAELSQEGGGIDRDTAGRAIVLAAMSNTVTKGLIVMIGGSPGLRRAILPVFLMILVTGLVVGFLI